MADADMDQDDLFADLYDGEDDDSRPVEEPVETSKRTPEPMSAPVETEPAFYDPVESTEEVNVKTEPGQGFQGVHGIQNDQQDPVEEFDKPIGIKEDGKMFIGGLNWETTDQSLKDYFSQFGEVIDCQVMRDGATGRSRGFGFLTFKDAKTVNTVMVKEHFLDGKLIDPKRAIPREEQERTAKIFVGGVSQECTEGEFSEFFQTFGRVLDATLMMDKDTGRPRGFGFVTFDSEAAVDRTLEQPLSIHGKFIEVKRAQPRGNLREDDGGHGKFQRGRGAAFNNDNNQQAPQSNQNGSQSGMTQAMLAQYWQRMQQYFQQNYQAMQERMMQNGGGGGGGMNMMAAMQNNPAMMQQMMAQGGMNPAMMQQMASMQGYPGMQNNGGGSPMNGGQGQASFNAQEQLMFEQQKYERQQHVRMQQGNFQGGNTWDGMYDDVAPPAGMGGGGGGGGNMRGGGFGGRGGRGGRGSQGNTPQPGPAAQAPANAPTGPKNAGLPGANYRGGGRGGRRGYHPYARGGM